MIQLGALLLKVFAIFLISNLVGFLIVGKAWKGTLKALVFRQVLGLCFINIISIFALLVGWPVKYGLLGLIPLVGLAIWKGDLPKLSEYFNKITVKYIFISLLGASCYLLPFFVEQTGGFYSRGGGDHNTYLALSDWYIDHSFLKKVEVADTEPVRPHFEVKYFTHYRQKDLFDGQQPLANQVFASAFMYLLPGAHEEAYTAAVAIYFATTIWAVVLLIGSALGIGEEKRIAFPVAAIVMLSNLATFIATTHAIPFLFSIGLMCSALLIVTELIKANQWVIKSKEFLVLFIISLTLFEIYPHIYVFTIALIGVSYLLHLKEISLTKFLRYFTAILLATLVGSLWISVPNLSLVIGLLTGGNPGFAGDYSWGKVIGAQSGVIDFLIGDGGAPGEQFLVHLAIVTTAIVFFVILSQLKKVIIGRRWLLLAMLTLFISGLFYYKTKGFGYQIIRFSEMGHLIYLSCFGFIVISWIVTEAGLRRWLGVIFLGVFMFGSVVTKATILEQILGERSTLTSEFRSSEDLEMVKSVARSQYCDGQGCQPKVLYLGNGYGVDLAGASVLLRELGYVAAYGYDYQDLFKPFEALRGKNSFDHQFLQKALIYKRLGDGGDILIDQRRSAAPAPAYSTKRAVVYDTGSQSVSELIGTYWGSPRDEYPSRTLQRVRYLQGKPGALVIWSKDEENILLRFEVTAAAGADAVRIQKVGEKEGHIYDVAPWNGALSSRQTIESSYRLAKGTNVFEISPLKKGGSTPGWLMFWKIQVLDR